MYFTKLACKDTKSISYTQARTHIFSQKVHFGQKNHLLSTFNFQLSTFICTFACYFVRNYEDNTRHNPNRSRDVAPLGGGHFP